MKKPLVASLVVAIALAPSMAHGQHGRGGGGGGWGGGGGNRGGNWSGGGGGGGGGFQGRGGSMGGGQRSGGGQHSGSNAGRGGGPSSHQAAHRPGPNHGYGPNHFAAHRPGYHGGWYHGDWHGRWAQPWGYRPWGWYWGGVGWGLGFGVGVAAVGLSVGSPWGWGYYSYWNPYWSGPYGNVTYINYAQPVAAAPPVAAPAYTLPGPSDDASVSANQAKALAMFDTARALFKRGDFQMALAQTNRAVALVPNDSLMHEFRALCLFATRDYQQSAAALYAVLSGGPGWDAATLGGLYPSANVYSDQLQALEAYARQNPSRPDARFLLAYHYMLGGRDQQAVAELQAVVRLQPKDQLSAQLLKGLTTAPVQPQGPALAPAATPSEPVNPASVVGDWKASRADGSKFELSLSEDNQFSWNFAQQDKQQQLKGTYTLANNFLILKASDQNALVGEVAMEPGDRLKFKLTGGSPADPGLTFTR